MLPGQRRQRHDPSRSFPVDLRCQHGSTRFTQVGLPFPVLQGSPRWFLTCQKPPERPPVHPGPSGIIPVHHGGTTVQPPVLPGSPRSMDRGVPGAQWDWGISSSIYWCFPGGVCKLNCVRVQQDTSCIRGRPWRYSVIPSAPDFPTEYQIRRNSNPAGIPVFSRDLGT